MFSSAHILAVSFWLWNGSYRPTFQWWCVTGLRNWQVTVPEHVLTEDNNHILKNSCSNQILKFFCQPWCVSCCFKQFHLSFMTTVHIRRVFRTFIALSSDSIASSICPWNIWESIRIWIVPARKVIIYCLPGSIILLFIVQVCHFLNNQRFL